MSTAAPASALTPVHNRTRRDVVVDAIRHALLAGELVPGQRVKESALADTLQVSRPTVREAVHQLAHEGLLEHVPYKGATVAEVEPDDLLEVAAVRVALETVAAQQLGRDPDGPGMRNLRRALQVHLEAIEDGDLVRIDLTHLAFHRTLWEGGDNDLLMRIWPLVEARIRMAIAMDQLTRSDPDRDAMMHERLVEVIADGDPDAIAAEVHAHIRTSAEEVVELLQNAASD